MPGIFPMLTLQHIAVSEKRGSLVNLLRWFLLLACLLIIIPQQKAVAGEDAAQELVIAVSASVPPYIDVSRRSGIEIQIIEQALTRAGYRSHFKFLSRKGAENHYNAYKVDAVLMNRSDDNATEGFASSDIIAYHNHAISLKQLNFQLKQVSDLSFYQVIGFNNASRYLGAEYRAAVAKSPLYREVEQQIDQVHALYRNIVDVVIADPRVFSHLQKEVQATTGQFFEVVSHSLFPESPRYLVFLNARVRDKFDQGLVNIRSDGRYESILAALNSH